MNKCNNKKDQRPTSLFYGLKVDNKRTKHGFKTYTKAMVPALKAVQAYYTKGAF